MSSRTPVLSCALVLLFTFTGCADDEPLRSAGEPCEAAGECESNLCFGTQCLDPAGDSDLDGLTNAIEASEGFGLDPLDADTDDDGDRDDLEVGDDLEAPLDSDEDGVIDAAESDLIDSDCDGSHDEEDPTDDGPPEGGEACAFAPAVDIGEETEAPPEEDPSDESAGAEEPENPDGSAN
ncbi:MAG: hypothetical protein QF464_11390 [Myxococcota bacterium]|jgi:hypothetical protein|nr:hypothetical protein [Myxococcota bacterium]